MYHNVNRQPLLGNYSMSGQKRHFMHTVYAGHLGLESDSEEDFIAAAEALFDSVKDDTGLRYLAGQVERCPDTDRLHIQAYSEWNTSLRLKQVAKRLPSHVELRKGTRTEARTYSTKKETRVHSLPELGVWRTESQEEKKSVRMKDVALKLIVGEEMTPDEIALHAPEVYFTHFRKIEALYNARKRAIAQSKAKQKRQALGNPVMQGFDSWRPNE
jgi:SHS2 domain-containing protein